MRKIFIIFALVILNLNSVFASEAKPASSENPRTSQIIVVPMDFLQTVSLNPSGSYIKFRKYLEEIKPENPGLYADLDPALHSLETKQGVGIGLTVVSLGSLATYIVLPATAPYVFGAYLVSFIGVMAVLPKEQDFLGLLEEHNRYLGQQNQLPQHAADGNTENAKVINTDFLKVATINPPESVDKFRNYLENVKSEKPGLYARLNPPLSRLENKKTLSLTIGILGGLGLGLGTVYALDQMHASPPAVVLVDSAFLLGLGLAGNAILPHENDIVNLIQLHNQYFMEPSEKSQVQESNLNKLAEIKYSF